MNLWPFLLLLVLFLLVVFWPFRAAIREKAVAGGARSTGQQQHNINVTLYREALAELKQQQHQGEMFADEFNEAEQDLKRRLLADNIVLQDATTGGVNGESFNDGGNNSGAIKQSFVLLSLAALLAVGGAYGLYRELGASQQVEITELSEAFYRQQQQALASGEQSSPELANQLISRLQEQLQAEPENYGLIYLLGSTYAQTGNYEQAIPLYKQYLMVNPSHERVLTEYVQFLYLAADKQLSERVKFVVERALTLNPHNQQVLTLLAMHHYANQNFQQAVLYWEQMLAGLNPDSEAYALVQNALWRTREEQQKHSQSQLNHGEQSAIEAATSGETGGEAGGETVDKPVEENN